MADVAHERVTYAEHVAIANDNEVRYEYLTGEVIAMAGGTVEHGRLLGAPLHSSIAHLSRWYRARRRRSVLRLRGCRCSVAIKVPLD